MKAIDIIIQNLKAGKEYGYYETNFSEYWWSVLSRNNRNPKMWNYTHCGSSAIKATKKDLEWLLSVIFEMTAEEFIEKYECHTAYEICEKLGLYDE